MNNKYHFSLHLQFKDDCNVDDLENKIDMRAYRKNMLKDSKGKNKTAKLWFKTKDFEEPDINTVLEKFLENLKPKYEIIKQANIAYNGNTVLTLYFEEVKQKPSVSLSKETIKLIAYYDFGFDIDFRL